LFETSNQNKNDMETKALIRGMANVSYWADDVKKAREWYAGLFSMQPYFQRPDAENPAYVEYRVGDYQHEVGIIDKKYMPKGAAQEPGGAVLYWHVDDIEKAVERLLSMGAKEYEPITKRGEGFITAAVIDPFGNVLGVMYNRHYLEMLSSK
jgi:predicted enzyme related to lactoylglutathione lyase